MRFEDIKKDKLYEVWSMFHRTDIDLTDERYISVGGHSILVTGRALIEMMNEGNVFTYISDDAAGIKDFSELKSILMEYIEGSKAAGLDDTVISRYELALQRAEKEEKLLGAIDKVSLDDRIKGIADREEDLTELIEKEKDSSR